LREESLMDRKFVLFAFNGEPMCFAHVLLNALDMHEKGFEVKVVIEGTATKTAGELADVSRPFSGVYRKVKEKGLVDCACRACAGKTGALADLEAQGLPLCDEMSGHPSMARYIEEGFEVVSF